ncbi:DNA (cytosine-5-)-methyltransferase [Clostridiales bacterium KA00134]|nr:DNA (cytosine-5-)-methyltransferase [Clostridiales bacterium KA00134]
MKFLDELKKVLSSDERFVGEADQIIKTKVSDAARANDEKLLKALLNNDLLKEAFFTKIDDIYVFDKNKFVWVLESKEFLPDSFTIYKNKIGLVDSYNNLISQKQDVSLVWPYKDCVLEGGQTKEYQKRDEIFYNETLAPDQVNILLAPKVLGNAKRYTKEGIEENIEFEEDDNLIIKGNNLLALSSLLSRYEGKVKLIYIDPPYNTKSDSFLYNDSFNGASWLTFMKNRLAIAYSLLKDDGIIFVQCDDNEQAYLKVLMDEIFGEMNFINNISVKMSEATGVKMSHASKRFPKLKEYLLFYKKANFDGFYEIDKYESEEWDNENNIFLENFTKNDRDTIRILEEKDINNEKDRELANEILNQVKIKSLSEKLKEYTFKSFEDEKNWLFENSYRIIKTAGSSSLKKVVMNAKNIPNQDIGSELSSQGVLFFYITDFNRNTDQPRLRVIFADTNIYKNPGDFWQDIKTTGAIAREGGVQLNNGKKPEKLIYRIIKMTTLPGDIVMDYHLGSGTTAAVAHKMNRRYIGIEQMDYIEDKAVKRLNNVINGDSTGISNKEDVNWQGGGSFVYCELLEDNENLVNELEDAKNSDGVKEVLNKAIDNGKLIPSVLPSDLKENEDDFDKLSLDEQKNLVMELLNKNQLYVNLSDIDDEDYKVSEADKTFTKSFYGKE